MSGKIIMLSFFFAGLLFNASAQAQQYDFKIENIELVGARRITLATVLTYVPIKVGDQLTPSLGQQVMHALYDTGFFKDVSLHRKGNILIIRVNERPAIAEINIEGNRKLRTEDITQAFDNFDLTRGRIYNDQVLDLMHQELERLYYSVGRYGVKIDKKVTPLPRNRVKIDLDIREGVSTEIRKIDIVGNEDFSDEEILKEFEQGIPSWYAIFSSKDEYAKSKLSGDRETLRSFYLDRGYINFRDESTQVTISPDKKDIYITINVFEGEQYNVRDINVTVTSPDIVQYKDRLLEIARKINTQGENFSNGKVTHTIGLINKFLGNVGYAFAETNMVPSVDEKTREVDINFVVNPRQRVYVRRILFNGNDRSLDEVYRREMRQMEGAWYSANAVERSKTRLQRLTFVESAEVNTPAVPGTDDKVDVIFDVKERFSGSFNIGIGYSGDNGAAFTTNVTQNNLFGTGNALSIALNSSEVVKNLSFSYTEPYYTDDGISRQLSAFFREVDTSRTLLSDYVMNSKGGQIQFGIPVTEYSRLGLGFSGSNIEIIPSSFSLVEVKDFLDTHGTEFDQFTGTVSYTYDSRNRGIFPTSGTRQAVSIEAALPVSDLEYYKLNYAADYYLPVSRRTLFHLKYNIGVGVGTGDLEELPFFEKYVAGGINTLRGFEARSIAPRGSVERSGIFQESQTSLGGDLMTLGSVEYVLPMGDGASARTVLFYDFGNVFAETGDFDADEFRSSVGVALNWLAPIGPMTFSYAYPLEKQGQSSEDIERFQFTVGGTF